MRIDVVLLKQWLIRATRDAYLIGKLGCTGYRVNRFSNGFCGQITADLIATNWCLK